MKHVTLLLSCVAVVLAVLSYVRSAPAAYGAAAIATNARAGLYASCDPGATQELTIYSSFNNVNAEPITARHVDGNIFYCFVKFPFPIKGHIALISSALMEDQQFVAVEEAKKNSYKVWITHPGGAPPGGKFYLVVY